VDHIDRDDSVSLDDRQAAAAASRSQRRHKFAGPFVAPGRDAAQHIRS